MYTFGRKLTVVYRALLLQGDRSGPDGTGRSIDARQLATRTASMTPWLSGRPLLSAGGASAFTNGVRYVYISTNTPRIQY